MMNKSLKILNNKELLVILDMMDSKVWGQVVTLRRRLRQI